MRVAYLLASFPNTSEIFIINEIAEAIKQGVDVRVFSLVLPQRPCPHAIVQKIKDRIEYLPAIENPQMMKVLLLHTFFFFNNPRSYLATVRYVIRNRQNDMLWAFKVCVFYAEHIKKFKPDLMHTHFAYGSSLFAMLISMMIGIPYTFTIHGWYDIYKAPPPFLREVIVNSKKTVTVCEYNRSYLMSEFHIPDGQLDVVRCGIPVGKFSPDNDKIDRLIISVGRLHYHKAYHVLVDACKLLADRGVPFSCWIIGDGELRENIQQQINGLGLSDKVLLLGEKSNEDVQALLPKANIFVLTSQVEVLGLVNAEAMASGIPVIGTSVFGVPELVEHGITGYLCDPNDPVSVADYLEFLLDHPDICREMGMKGREKVNRMHNLTLQVNALKNIWV